MPARAQDGVTGKYIASYSGTLTVDGAAQSFDPNSTSHPFGNCSHTATLKITATMTWTPYPNPNGLAPPPPSQNFLEGADAGGSGSGPVGASVTADDGMGDTPVPGSQTYPDHTDLGVDCRGKYVRTGYSGATITLPARTMTVTYSGSGNGNGVFGYEVDPDSRGVTIGSSLGQTYHKSGSNKPAPNVRQANGTLTDDTVLYAGSGGYIFNFNANAVGSWSTGSTYNWYSSLSGYSANGVWPNINTFSVPEYANNIGQKEHIFISLNDAGNQAKASGNYYLYLHAHLEPTSMPEDSGSPYKVMGPDPDDSSWPTYPWTAATDRDGKIVPPLIGPQGGNATINFGGSYTQGGNAGGALGISFSDVNAELGGGYDWSKSSDASININPTPALPAQEQTWAVMRLSVKRHKGHQDIYGTQGFTGTGVWYKDDIVTTDYSYYQPYQPTNVTPFNPAPGWNPPGYN